MAEAVRSLSFDEVVDRLLALREPYHEKYKAMYSSWFGGIITEPQLMVVPVDDHLVHRGDGVFEAFKSVDWNVYALERHLDRMQGSAARSAITFPVSRERMVEIILATLRAGGTPDTLVKLLVSRGPGGFSANPYECPAAQLYIIVAALELPSKEKYERGVRIKTSGVPIKSDYFANIKSCNYLPNVLMAKEAKDAGVDFTVSMDERGFLAEAPTENIGLVTKDREFLSPRFDRTLRGVTISRTMELAQKLLDSGQLTRIAEADITRAQARDAAEIMIFGTSFDILPAVDYDGHTIGDGRPGPIYRQLVSLLREDIRGCPEMLTPVRG